MADVERERVTALWREAAAAVEEEIEFGAGRGSDTKGAGSPDIPRPTPCAECGRLREQLDAAAIGLDLAIGVHDKLRMDTAEEEALRLEVLRTLRLARAALGVEGEQEKEQ